MVKSKKGGGNKRFSRKFMTIKDKALFIIARCVRKNYIKSIIGGILMLAASIGYDVYKSYTAEAKIEGSISKYKHQGVLLYGGKLINVSKVHADKLTLKGSFMRGKIIDLKIQTTDVVEYQKYGNPVGSVEFALKRLSKKNKCFFDIIVDPKGGDIEETIHSSWGKEGSLVLSPQQADEDTVMAIQRGIDLSLKARQKWLRSNTRNIGKQK